MNISEQIIETFPGLVDTVQVDKKADLYGQSAVKVEVALVSGKLIEGKFTTEARPGFGGVEFSSKKDIAGLMISKIRSVMIGAAE